MHTPSRREWLGGAGLALLAGRLRALPLSQIKLGVTTDEIDDDVSAAVKFLRQYGLSWAEVRNIWGKYNTEQPMEKIREARGIFDQQGIKVSIDDTPFFRIPLPPESPEGQRILDEQWALLNRSLERAKAFVGAYRRPKKVQADLERLERAVRFCPVCGGELWRTVLPPTSRAPPGLPL